MVASYANVAMTLAKLKALLLESNIEHTTEPTTVVRPKPQD
jgi:hypothetical protein